MAAYRHVAAELAGRRLVIRTLDAGGDKRSPRSPPRARPIPSSCARRPPLACPPRGAAHQLRALLRAAAGQPIAVMFPMVAELPELQAARGHLDYSARRELAAEGIATGRVEVGVTVEVPSAALCADTLAADVDFLSIGTNDLTQYALAVRPRERRPRRLCDHLHPAVLRLVDVVCRAADARGIPVAVCGEAAGDADAVGLLVGLGVRELSVPPSRVAEVKRLVRELDPAAAADLARRALSLADAGAVRELVVRARADRTPPA